MNQSFSKQTLAREISAIILNSDLSERSNWILMEDQILDVLSRTAGALLGNPDLDHVNADIVTLRAVDLDSGQIIRRILPLTLTENHNALRLAGETLNGRPSEIVFFPESACQKMSELTGHGQDKPQCK